jgi:uncharacterized protein (TIGR03118 family)
MARRETISSMKILRFLVLVAGSVAGSAMAQNAYVKTVLVANDPKYHPQLIDTNMVDAWGMAIRPPGAGGHFWISNAATGTSVEYIGDVNGTPLHQDGLKTVTLQTPRWTDRGIAYVTGQTYNSASDLPGQPIEFPISGPAMDLTTNPATRIPKGFSGSAKFIFFTEDGALNAWSANTKVAMDQAPLVIDYSKTSGHNPYPVNCVFTGGTVTNNAFNSDAYRKAGGNHIFAADLRNNVIEVFDNQWKDVTSSFHFQVPATVGDLHVYNVLDLGGHLFVAYAKFDVNGDEGQEEVDAPGLGHIVEYNEDGTLVRDYKDHGKLNAPWGMVIAPQTFGALANDLLVANFGDNNIVAFDLNTGEYVDCLRGSDGQPLPVEGVWALTFGNGVSLGDAKALYYSAGPNKQFDGLFGRINLATSNSEAQK